MQYRNTNDRSFNCFPPSRVDWQNLPDRSIITNVPDPQVSSNQIKTTNSNFLTFIPMNIFKQLTKSANIYFIIVAILQSIPSISVTNGQPMVLIPFSMVLIGVLLKDGYEEYSRYQKDLVANNQHTQILGESGFQLTTWEKLMIGNLILVNKEEFAPCDFVVLQTSDKNGKCYVETKNLDGETNCKTKNIPQFTKFDLQKCNPSQLWKLRMLLKYEKPNPNLHHFNGSIETSDQKAPLRINNLVLRGSSIQIVDWVIGVCVYTGKQTKLMLNFIQFRTKRSNLDQLLGNVAIIIILIQFLFSFTCSALNYFIQQNSLKQLHEIPGRPFYKMMGSWWLTMSYFVPVSLIVSLETVKVAQAVMMNLDSRMKSTMNDSRPQTNNSSVNEDLGQIRYIFSDKTGTLTSNIMNFKVLSLNGTVYGNLRSQDSSAQLQKQMQSMNVTNVNFEDKQFMKICGNEKVEDFFRILYLCHEVIIQNSSNKQAYSGSSPDQIAFINFAKLCGYEYEGQQNKIITIKNKHSQSVQKYKVLAVLEFSSDRKRMSVVVQHQSGQIFMYTKGADNLVAPRLKQNDPLLKKTLENIDQFSTNGFRTLLLAKRKVQKSEFDRWFAQYSKALTSIQQRQKKVEKVCQVLEVGLEVVGATGIQDKLQQNVKQTIQQLTSAGIVIYMLTGDKRQTAVNIGRSCGMIGHNTKIITIPQNLTGNQYEQWSIKNSPIPSNSVLLLNASAPMNNMKIPLHPTICYRCTPSQKQNIVDSVKSQTKQLTLAIGDGSNDVNMITRADVGISIKGVEGNDATRISDFVLGQFSLLSPLVLYYGREWYRKNSKLVTFVMFKNVYHVAALFGFGTFSMFSAQVIYQLLLYQFFNTMFTIAGGCIYAVLDEEWSMKQSMQNPFFLYPPGQENTYFNYSVYFKSLFLGMFYGITTQAIVFRFMEMCSIHSGGRTSYLVEGGMIIFFLIVFVINIKVLLMAHIYHLALIVAVIASIVAYFIFYFALTWYFKDMDAAHALITFFTTPTIWAIIVIVCFITLGLDFAIKKYSDYNKNMLFNIQKQHMMQGPNKIPTYN